MAKTLAGGFYLTFDPSMPHILWPATSQEFANLRNQRRPISFFHSLRFVAGVRLTLVPWHIVYLSPFPPYSRCKWQDCET
jgi:hypothetical protein